MKNEICTHFGSAYILFAVALFMIYVVLIFMAMAIKHLSKEICEIEARLQHYQIRLEYLESCVIANEHRIDELEDMLDLNEWFDKEKGGEE